MDDENVCEHGDHPAPEGKRFCSPECAECERGTRECKWCAWEKNPPDLGIAISVHAAWAWAMMQGAKDVENRAPNFPRRHGGREVLGRVWIHASLWPGSWSSLNSALWLSEREKMHCLAADYFGGLRWREQELEDALRRIRGHIVGSVEVYGYADSSESPWYVPGSLAILVRNQRPVAKPVPAKGALGWWRVPEPVLEACREAA